MRRLAVVVAALVLVAAGYAGYRAYIHAGALLVPAVITRAMDAASALDPGLPARVDRLLHEPSFVNAPRLVALTFDDGPYPVSTPLLLAELHRLRIHATFFLIGRDAQEFPELARRIGAEGNEIGDHTLTHPENFDRLPAAQVQAQLREGTAALRAFTNQATVATMWRPPHGRFTEQTVVAAQQAGYDTMLWNDDPGDWRHVTPQELVDHIERYASAPDIILLHSGQLATIEMLPVIVARFRAAGFTFVTAGELLRQAGATAINRAAKRPL